MHLTLTIHDREVDMDMTYDPGFRPDVDMKFLLERDNAVEPEVMHLMGRVLREGDFVVDAGANVGFFTVLMAKLVGYSGRVLAFEPGINNLTKLSDNIGVNKLRNVTPHAVALWSEPADKVLYLSDDSGLNSLAPNGAAVSEVPTRTETLDAYCRGVAPRLIKLDVEGAEEHVLRGAEDILERGVSYITCELNEPALARLDSNQQSLRTYCYQQGYQMFCLHPDGSLPTLVPPSTRLVPGHHNLNVLFSSVMDVGLAWPEVAI